MPNLYLVSDNNSSLWYAVSVQMKRVQYSKLFIKLWKRQLLSESGYYFLSKIRFGEIRLILGRCYYMGICFPIKMLQTKRMGSI